MSDINRFVIKISGESGQGINAIGEVVARALKKTGYYTFGYREYPSLIKGGWAFHQIDFSDKPLTSSSEKCDILVCFSRFSTLKYVSTLKEGGQLIHMIPELEFTEEDEEYIKSHNIKTKYIPADVIATDIGGKAIMANSVLVGALWQLLNLPIAPLAETIKREFSHKPEAIDSNLSCIKKGYKYSLDGLNLAEIHFKKSLKIQNDALLTGNHLIALGAISAGVRAYFGYPMTPSSSILSYISSTYHETGILTKQLDDEISVAQFTIGSMFMGTRALTATSGGGFDLMTESVSLSAMVETPFVCVLAQRPGPATGLPTWTAATDLNLAVYAGHGEYTRCVIAVSTVESAYTSIQNAFNIAEKYQMPVIVLTDKAIAESLFQVSNLPNSPKIDRFLVPDTDLDTLVPSDRFKITKSGISPRWLPGQSDATFVGNSDEHLGDGSLTEEAEPSAQMHEKRLKKYDTLLSELPEPQVDGPENAKITFVGWGSVRNVMIDSIQLWNNKNPENQINFLNYEYIYPTKTKTLVSLFRKKNKIVLIENNSFGQLGALLTQKTGVKFKNKLLKHDGRPFFIEEILDFLERNTSARM